MIKAEYVSHMGDDLMVVNAARVSFAKQSEAVWDVPTGKRELRDRDAKLIGYLAKHGHWTPFAHPQVCLRMSAPIFVARQAFKHKVGFVENEISRRYVDDEPELYLPEVWRGRAEDKKQGSAGEIVMEEMRWKEHPAYFVEQFYFEAQRVYERALECGVAPEQARMVLPQAMMTEWYWTGSLASWARFCRLRLAADAQAEITELARSAEAHIAPLFPVSWAALVGVET